jgi:predicted ester cyclase
MSDKPSNQQVVERFVESLNRGDIDGAVAPFAEDAENFGYRAGHDGLRAILGDILTRFPDVKLTVDQWIVAGDWIVIRGTYSGTHRGIGRLPIDGGMLIGVPPTGRSFAVLHVHLFRVENGRIKEHWGGRDDIGMMRQLGLLPPAAADFGDLRVAGRARDRTG